jgi:hypothetical protein
VTLVADTVSTVTLPAPAPSTVEIVNVDGSAEVYVSVDGTNPTVDGDGFWVLPAAIGFLQLDPRASSSGTATVKLISSGTPKVSVGVIA